MMYLNVPFAQKDQAKSLGARWDPIARKWYLPDELVAKAELFSPWLIEPVASVEKTVNSDDQQTTLANDAFSDFFSQASQVEQSSSVIDSVEMPDLSVNTKGQSLSSLMQKIQQAIWQSFAGAQWVVAEVSNLNERRGHLYLELSETDANGRTIANARGMIWQGQAVAIKHKFEQETQMTLATGQKLLMLCEVKFHAQYGLSLEIQEIDSRFSLGELEQKVRQIREQLQKEGVYSLNKQLSLPNDFFNIAVIAPPKAAGLGDFQADAERLSALELCKFSYFFSSFQGKQVEKEFGQAFDKVLQQHQKTPFDALVIIRGGGAKLDLHQLNEYRIAKAITASVIPVMCGIGHERDNTILDEVAHSRFDTPSKVIHFIWQQILNQATTAKQNWQTIQQTAENTLYSFDKHLEQLWRQIEQTSQQQVHHWRQAIVLPYQHLQQQASHLVQQEKRNLQWLDEQIKQFSLQQVLLTKQNLNALEKEVNQHALAKVQSSQQQLKDWMALILNAGPQVQIERGFAIVSNTKGQTLTTKQQAQQESRLNLEFKDGLMSVAVDKNEAGDSSK